MVREIDKKYSNLLQAYEAFSQAIDTQKRITEPLKAPGILDISCAGLIKHFELAYETLWKFLKHYTQMRHEVIVTSPKEVFRACYTHRILSEDIIKELIQLADARNKATHQYDRIVAREICDDVIKHHLVMGTICGVVVIYLTLEKIAV